MSIFNLTTYEQLIKLPPKEWYVDGLFGPLDLIMIFGREGRGKTFVAIDLMASLLSQKDFANFFPVLKRINIIYATDEGTASIPSRFQAAFSSHSIKSTESLLSTFSMVQLFDSKNKANLARFIAEIKDAGFNPDLIVIDTLYNAAIGSNENSVTDAGVVIDSAKKLRDEFSCAILFIHHSDKSGRWPRGASSYLGSMDCIIEIEYGKMSCYKMKDAPKFEPLNFNLDATNLGVEIEWIGKADESKESLVLQVLADNQKYSAKQLSVKTELSPSSLSRILERLIGSEKVSSGLLYPEKVGSNRNPRVYWLSDILDMVLS